MGLQQLFAGGVAAGTIAYGGFAIIAYGGTLTAPTYVYQVNGSPYADDFGPIPGLTDATYVLDARSVAGSGPVLVDLVAGTVVRGGQLDARVAGIGVLTLGADPTVVRGPSTGSLSLYGGTGRLDFYGAGADDTIQGGTGTNNIVGGSGTEAFTSGGGVDAMLGGSGFNAMLGGSSAASVDVLYGNGGADVLTGAGGTATLIGGTGTETLYGGAGANTLVGLDRPSADGTLPMNVFYGGTGTSAGTDVFYAGVGTNVMDEGAGTSGFRGGAGTGYIQGGAGRSFVTGGSGTDVVTTGAGDQTVVAGSGRTFFNDTAAFLTAGRLDLDRPFRRRRERRPLPAPRPCRRRPVLPERTAGSRS